MTKLINDLPTSMILRVWQHMLKRHPKERGDGRATAEGVRWHVLDDFGLVVSLTLGLDFARVFIRGEAEAKESFIRSKVEPYSEALEQALGVAMDSDEPGRFFVDRLEIDVSDESNWDAISDWLFERAQSYEAALNEYLPKRR